MGEFIELCELLECVVIDVLLVLVCDGGVIVLGYSEELDEWWVLVDGVIDYFDKLEICECEWLGFDILKVGYNVVYGYYIQISCGQSYFVLIYYVCCQMLKNVECYIIFELKEYEDKVLIFKGKVLVLEKQFYDELFDLLLLYFVDL